MNQNLSLDELRGMLRLRRAEQQHRVAEEQERLARLERRLKQIEREGDVPDYEVIVKSVGPQLVASVREVIPMCQDAGRLFGELYACLGQYGAAGLAAAIWHDEGYKEQDVNAEAAVYIKNRVPENGVESSQEATQ